MRILVDMDEIVVNLLDEWIRIYNREWDDNLMVDDIDAWDTHKFVKPACGKQIYQILKRPGLFDYLPPHAGAIDAITTLVAAGHDVRFATAPPSADSCRGKIEWVKRHFAHPDFGMSQVLMLHDKNWLAPSVDVLVDDKPKTIVEWREYADRADNAGYHSPRIMTIAHPYNKPVLDKAHVVGYDANDTQRAWETIVEAINKLAEERD